MRFSHSSEIWADFPELVACAIFTQGITKDVSVTSRVTEYNAVAESRLIESSVGELPEIQAWRRTFSKMGLKPTKYRCASEALLRRFNKEKSLPQIHPLIDLCNAISLAFAIPIAAFDTAQITGDMEVRYAVGDETYLTFSGQVEPPKENEVIFADTENKAHARRWTNRQSAYSAIRDETSSVLIVAEALHGTASEDIKKIASVLIKEITEIWPCTIRSEQLNQLAPEINFGT